MMTKDEMPACPVATTVQLIGSKWKLLILRDLLSRPWRFNELRRDLEGVSQKVLTDSLRALEADGIVRRTVYPEVPPRVEYSLTELGRSLQPILDAMKTGASSTKPRTCPGKPKHDKGRPRCGPAFWFGGFYKKSSFSLRPAAARHSMAWMPSSTAASAWRAWRGQITAQRMQCRQASRLIRPGSCGSMACTGHRAAHRPQRMQASVGAGTGPRAPAGL